jgi:amidase
MTYPTVADELDAADPTAAVVRALTSVRERDGQIRGVTQVLHDAVIEAGRIDGGALQGVAFAVKANFDVCGHPTTHGVAGKQPAAVRDSPLIARLRSSGAVPVALTAMAELAMFGTSDSPAHGVVRNPRDLRGSPGGSSGGSAAAVAAGHVSCAIGTDGAGSIRVPAACCGVVGLKPEPGVVPADPPDHWRGLTTAGMFTRTVTDQAMLLDALDPSGALGEALRCSPTALRIGWTMSAPGHRGGAPDAMVRQALTICRALGFAVEHVSPDWSGIGEAFRSRYLAGIRDDITRLGCRRDISAAARPVFWAAHAITPRQLERAALLSRRAAERLDELCGCDILLQPVLNGPVPSSPSAMTTPALLWTGRRLSTFTHAWNVTGHPAITLPLSPRPGHAVQFVARRGATAMLLSFARLVESCLARADVA